MSRTRRQSKRDAAAGPGPNGSGAGIEQSIANILAFNHSAHHRLEKLEDQYNGLGGAHDDLAKRVGELESEDVYVEQQRAIEGLADDYNRLAKRVKDLEIQPDPCSICRSKKPSLFRRACAAVREWFAAKWEDAK